MEIDGHRHKGGTNFCDPVCAMDYQGANRIIIINWILSDNYNNSINLNLTYLLVIKLRSLQPIINHLTRNPSHKYQMNNNLQNKIGVL